MSNMSFALTTCQIRARTKDVTRRLGWRKLRPGTVVQAVVKSQGLRKGEHPEVLDRIRILRNDPEPLNEIVHRPCRGVTSEVEREGFLLLTPQEFVAMFRQHMRCKADAVIRRIEFEYVD